MYPAVFYTYDGHFLIGKKKKDQDSGVCFFFCLFVFIVVCCFIFVWLVSLLVWFFPCFFTQKISCFHRSSEICRKEFQASNKSRVVKQVSFCRVNTF